LFAHAFLEVRRQKYAQLRNLWVVYDLCLVDELKALPVSSKAFEERLEKSRIDVSKTKSAVPGCIAPVSALYKKTELFLEVSSAAGYRL
jgi:hypothetical protein